MASRLINNNSKYNQNKYYRLLFQESILVKFSVKYASLIAIINDEYINYTSANLSRTFYKIKWYLKTNVLKILYAISISRSSNSNKRLCQIPKSSIYSHLICFSKNYHLINKSWELYWEFQTFLWWIRIKPTNIKLKGNVAFKNIKNEALSFNLNELSKILTTNLPYLKKSLWLLDYAGIYAYIIIKIYSKILWKVECHYKNPYLQKFLLIEE